MPGALEQSQLAESWWRRYIDPSVELDEISGEQVRRVHGGFNSNLRETMDPLILLENLRIS